MENENIIFRVTSFKSNGSVWTKTYEDEKKLLEVLPVLYTQFPHVMVSRQTLKKPHLEYLRDMGERNED